MPYKIEAAVKVFTVRPVYVCTQCKKEGLALHTQKLVYDLMNTIDAQDLSISFNTQDAPDGWCPSVEGWQCEECTVGKMSFSDLTACAIARKGWQHLPKIYHDRLKQLDNI